MHHSKLANNFDRKHTYVSKQKHPDNTKCEARQYVKIGDINKTFNLARDNLRNVGVAIFLGS